MGSSLSLALGKKKTEEMILPEISEEIKVEILMRLPVKSLMRFKCVSKLWISLITSRFLTNRFLKSCSSHQRSFAYIADDKDSSHAVLTSSARDHFDASVSVMDQFLTLPGMQGNFVSAVRGLACFTFEDRVRICNIHTRHVVELPPLTSSKAIEDNIHEMYYFGHDPVNDEYKVLSVVFDISKNSTEHQVLVLGAGAAWRKIQCHIPHNPADWQGMTINGVLYYIASTDPVDSSTSRVLMSFDLSSEELKLIELSDMVRTLELSRNSLMNYKGKIAVFEYSRPMNDDGTVNVWVLKDAEKSKWSNKKTFVLPNVVGGDWVIMHGPSHSSKVWLLKAETDMMNQHGPLGYLTHNLPALHYFIYDLERNEIAQRIEIRILDFFRTLRTIGGIQLFPSVKADLSFLAFWDDRESIMYLEI